jgi:shikimate kinase
MQDKKEIIILIGQKGSGKTFVGRLLQEKFGIFFLRVEDICLKIKGDRQIYDIQYISETFELIEKEIRLKLIDIDQIIIESAGAAAEFDFMLESLKREFTVRLINIYADPDLCLQRVKSRSMENHIAVSDDNVEEINRISLSKHYKFDLIITNNNISEKEILDEWNKLISDSNPDCKKY